MQLSEPDLIDRIANALPVEVRADYYRELRHCRSLPENDEMLRILRAMEFSGCTHGRGARAHGDGEATVRTDRWLMQSKPFRRSAIQ